MRLTYKEAGVIQLLLNARTQNTVNFVILIVNSELKQKISTNNK